MRKIRFKKFFLGSEENSSLIKIQNVSKGNSSCFIPSRESLDIDQWLILTACQPFKGYFIPWGYGIAFIEYLDLYFCLVF